MTVAFVLGNGVSRQHIGINGLCEFGKIYGCNMLYSEFAPEALVATDKPIATRIQDSGYPLKHRFYTRRPIEGKGGNELPKSYFGFSSGPIAIAIAALDQQQHIYLLGFDFGPTLDKRFNNIYAGTEFYKPIDASPTFTGNWIRQLIKVVGDFPNTKFFRVVGETTARIPELESIHNLKHLPMKAFEEKIYNTKEL